MKKLLEALLAALMLLMLSACGGSNGLPALKVTLPTGCDRLLQAVDVTPVKNGDDLRLAAARRGVALALANRRLAEARACLDGQRKAYAK